jgi:hypothetical protein
VVIEDPTPTGFHPPTLPTPSGIPPPTLAVLEATPVQPPEPLVELEVIGLTSVVVQVLVDVAG